MQGLRIILLCILAAVGYGCLHDNVTARVCVEYFTIGHHPPFASENPTVLAFFFGVAATWWFGLLLGIPLAVVSVAGRWPKLTWRDQVVPLLVVFAAAGVLSLVAGMAGYHLAQSGQLHLREPFASRVPAEKHVAFLADGAAHLAAYGSGLVGAIILWIATPLRRYFRAAQQYHAMKLAGRLKSC